MFRITQRPGTFVVTFPRAMHAGFGQGFQLGEAANFALRECSPAPRLSVGPGPGLARVPSAAPMKVAVPGCEATRVCRWACRRSGAAPPPFPESAAEWWPFAVASRELYKRLRWPQCITHEQLLCANALDLMHELRAADLQRQWQWQQQSAQPEAGEQRQGEQRQGEQRQRVSVMLQASDAEAGSPEQHLAALRQRQRQLAAKIAAAESAAAAAAEARSAAGAASAAAAAFVDMVRRLHHCRALLEAVAGAATVLACPSMASEEGRASLLCPACLDLAYVATAVPDPSGPPERWRHLCLQCAATRLLEWRGSTDGSGGGGGGGSADPGAGVPAGPLIFLKPIWGQLEDCARALERRGIRRPEEWEGAPLPLRGLQRNPAAPPFASGAPPPAYEPYAWPPLAQPGAGWETWQAGALATLPPEEAGGLRQALLRCPPQQAFRAALLSQNQGQGGAPGQPAAPSGGRVAAPPQLPCGAGRRRPVAQVAQQAQHSRAKRPRVGKGSRAVAADGELEASAVAAGAGDARADFCVVNSLATHLPLAVQDTPVVEGQAFSRRCFLLGREPALLVVEVRTRRNGEWHSGDGRASHHSLRRTAPLLNPRPLPPPPAVPQGCRLPHAAARLCATHGQEGAGQCGGRHGACARGWRRLRRADATPLRPGPTRADAGRGAEVSGCKPEQCSPGPGTTGQRLAHAAAHPRPCLLPAQAPSVRRRERLRAFTADLWPARGSEQAEVVALAGLAEQVEMAQPAAHAGAQQGMDQLAGLHEQQAAAEQAERPAETVEQGRQQAEPSATESAGDEVMEDDVQMPAKPEAHPGLVQDAMAEQPAMTAAAAPVAGTAEATDWLGIDYSDSDVEISD